MPSLWAQMALTGVGSPPAVVEAVRPQQWVQIAPPSISL